MRVAVVRNDDRSGVLAPFGQPSPETYAPKTIAAVAAALESLGHEVAVIEGDVHLLAALAAFMPRRSDGSPGGVVFNMAYGIQGESRYTHVPAMLEMAGIPYTGSSVLGHAIALDKVVAKRMMIESGVPTPRFAVVPPGGDTGAAGALRFPLVVKPRHESTSFGIELVGDGGELDAAVGRIASAYAQDVLVEEYVDGREVCVALLGNEPADVLPVVEQDFGARDARLLTFDDKFHRAGEIVEKQCPAVLGDALRAELERIALRTFSACCCRDFARVDVRIARDGIPYVLEINSMASLGTGGSYVLAAQAAGLTYDALVARMLDLAVARARTPVEVPAGG